MEVAPTVLIVDDDVVIRRLLRHMLERHGYTVLVAVNGEEALELLQGDERVDVAIVDRSMPVLDGLGLVRALRASERYAALPVIMLTASIAPSVQDEARAVRVDRLMTKLVGSHELVSAVDDLLGRPPATSAS